jgi:hypothetical protein
LLLETYMLRNEAIAPNISGIVPASRFGLLRILRLVNALSEARFGIRPVTLVFSIRKVVSLVNNASSDGSVPCKLSSMISLFA